MRAARRYRFMDLFAGCGGLTRGFVDSGRFDPAIAIDMDSDAAATYRANFGDHVIPSRIEEVDLFPAVEVVVGGPPCQGFSPLNRSRVGLERRSLWRDYIRALECSGAQAFVMENVPQLLTSEEFASFSGAAVSLGFGIEADVLNAADFGVPQKRRRAIVVGLRGGVPRLPVRSHQDPLRLELGGQPWLTFRDAVAGLPIRPNGVNWHRARRPHPESIERYRAVPSNGGNRFQMQENLERAGLHELVPPCFRRKATGTTDVFGRLWWGRPSVTIRTEFYKPEKGRYLHPVADRPITVREAARCMSFEDDFVFPEEQSMTSVARQIGNAVPPLLARRIAEELAVALDARDSLSGGTTADRQVAA